MNNVIFTAAGITAGSSAAFRQLGTREGIYEKHKKKNRKNFILVIKCYHQQI